ncbi:hypothetical protein DM02DRAFT_635564 [Periconia macrospinosa]|uniref:Subtelomeric hrmA-associated cluster protein AFUB-079030/YDR124W-like helical bundle domain-containing protein n=1 Tax=Periconia macrospinosa TaxID=97972 RepID=A0A2V1D4M9_9PLEO|nr:hypothetical protein DM02DRAFT_635564 [Periconia macrospinosa]
MTKTTTKAKLPVTASSKLNDEYDINFSAISTQTPGRGYGVALKTAQAPARSYQLSKCRAARGIKRARSTNGLEASHNWDYQDPNPIPGKSEQNVLNVNDSNAVKAFYKVRLEELGTKPLRPIVTAWVKRLAPQRANDFGNYRKTSSPDSLRPEGNYPPWWPCNAPYIEPSHLKSRFLILLAISIMMVYCDTKIERKRSWISELLHDAEYIVRSTPDETFASSTNLEFNRSMKTRALDEILPSLFHVAKAYEDNCNKVGNQESSSKEYSDPAKTIYWQYIHRPRRGSPKKHCLEKPAPKAPEKLAPKAPERDMGVDGENEHSPSIYTAEPNLGNSEVALMTPSPVAGHVQLGPCHPTVENLPSSLQFSNRIYGDCNPMVPAMPESLSNMANTYKASSSPCEATHSAFTSGEPSYYHSNVGGYNFPVYPAGLYMEMPSDHSHQSNQSQSLLQGLGTCHRRSPGA